MSVLEAATGDADVARAGAGGMDRPVDLAGYPTTCSDPAVLPLWADASMAFLAHAAILPEKLAAIFALDPEFPLAHIAKGYFMLLLGRRELDAEAASAYARVAPARERLTRREQAYLEGLRLYLDGRILAAADVLDAELARSPADAVLVKLSHALRFVVGDAAGMRRSLEAVLHAYEGPHPYRAFIRGCYAFALEETGAYVEAERIGREAVARCQAPSPLAAPYGDAWGLHAVAHVYDMTNRAADGVAWITKRAGAWAHCNNFRYHVWWHLALFHLDRGDYSEVLRLYDEEVRFEAADDYRDISNAASLLTRLELEGVAVGDRWAELAEISERRADDGCVVFADLHYLLALGAAGRGAAEARMLERLRRSSEARISALALGAGSRDQDDVAAAAGAPAAAGLIAFAKGDYAEAYAGLASAEAAMPRVGGSWAQRDVFERLAIDSALRAGLLREARGRLQRRLRRRGALDRYAETRLSRIGALEAAARD